MILDTNGDGRRGEYTEPNQPLDPNKDRRYAQVFYAVMPNPADGSVWGTIRFNPGAVARINPGPNPSETALTEVYNVPMPGYGPRGGDIDSQGVVWVSLASGHMGASTGASAKARSTGRRRPATTAPKAGRSTSTRARASKASVRTARSRATTAGSTSTTRSASAATCRCRPPT